MRSITIWISILVSIGTTATAADLPKWLSEVASLKLPDYPGKVPAAVLLNDKKVTVDESGRMEITRRYALRILNPHGRERARARCIYLTDSGKMRDLRAWLMYPSGKTKSYGKSETLDIALAANDVYNEVRARVIDASRDADAGSVFGFESVSEDHSIFTQLEWQFQDDLPVMFSGFTLALPQGWRAEGITYNHAVVEPLISGSTYHWQVRQLPFIEKEWGSPGMSSLVPRLATSFYPPPGRTTGAGPAFRDWADVSRWLTALHEPQSNLTEALVAKAKALTVDAVGELQRIQAIARFVQSINYVSIQTGVGRGGGYQPHSAPTVLDKSYGDCKDKANLMRTLLRAVGVESYPVAIYAGDRTHVRAEWTSPQQFNHAIVAVRVGEHLLPAVSLHSKLGRLLFFDPTDDATPLGYLPIHEQGSLALVIAGEAGELVRTPVADSSVNSVDRRTTISLTADGSVTANFRDESFGEAAVEQQKLFRLPGELLKWIERSITERASTAKISKIDTRQQAGGQFILDVDFTAPFYGQIMQDRLLVFKPAVIAGPGMLASAERDRKHPIVLNAHTFSETARVQLPPGFRIDETPDAIHATTPFASFVASWEDKGDHLIFTRRLETHAAIIPAEEYHAVRHFFAQVYAAGAAPVTLVRTTDSFERSLLRAR